MELDSRYFQLQNSPNLTSIKIMECEEKKIEKAFPNVLNHLSSEFNRNLYMEKAFFCRKIPILIRKTTESHKFMALST